MHRIKQINSRESATDKRHSNRATAPITFENEYIFDQPERKRERERVN